MAEVGLTRMERGVATLIAILLLAFQLAIPPGFMVSAKAQGPRIVICTGHGPLTVQTEDHGKSGQAPHSKASGACPFAGHGGAPLVPQAPTPSAVSYEPAAVVASVSPDLLPGRGLAAPPPPSQGPPLSLI